MPHVEMTIGLTCSATPEYNVVEATDETGEKSEAQEAPRMSYAEARKVRGRWEGDILNTARTWVHSTTDKAREWQPRSFVAYTEVDVQGTLNDAWVGGADTVDVAVVTAWGSLFHHFDFVQMLVTSTWEQKARAL